MATLSDLKLSHRVFMQTYRYRSIDWLPGARLTKALSRSKVALITTAGVHLPDQTPFDNGVRGGDYSWREFGADVDVQMFQIAHRSSAFDQTGALEDRNLIVPLDRLRELVALGGIAALNHRHFSFMGSITAPGRLITETAPEVAVRLRQDLVDAVLLVPV